MAVDPEGESDEMYADPLAVASDAEGESDEPYRARGEFEPIDAEGEGDEPPERDAP